MKIEEVPELTLPIIKPNRDYFCQYCDKVKGNYPRWEPFVCMYEYTGILQLLLTDGPLALSSFPFR